MTGQTEEVLNRIRVLVDGNTSPALLLQELLECVHLLSVISSTNISVISDSYSKEEKTLAENITNNTDTVFLTCLWQILFRGIEELKISFEPLISLEMLLLRACHMSLMPSPDTLIKSLLENGSRNKTHFYNLEKKSSLKTKEKSEIIKSFDGVPKDIETDKSKENSDNRAVKEILDIFPGAKVKK